MSENSDDTFERAKEHFLAGLMHILHESWTEAEKQLQASLTLLPDRTSTLINLSTVLIKLEKVKEARALLERIHSLDPHSSELALNQGLLFSKELRHEEALTSYKRSIELRPDYAEAWLNRGVALNELKRYAEALASYDRSIELQSDYAQTWNHRGNLLVNLGRYEEALASYERAIEVKPDYAEAWLNRGVVLNELKHYSEALASYERSIELKSDDPKAWSNRGNTLRDLQRHEEALASYERSIELKPDADYVLGDLVHTQMKICDWANLDERCQTLSMRLLAGDQASAPFNVLGLFDKPQLQKQCAELYSENRLGSKGQLLPITRKSKRGKIRLAYFSMDFRQHPVAHLITELIECHDRNKFEVFGFSFGVNTGDAMRKRLEIAFDNFLEVRHLSELDIALLARDCGVDIAIDLGGYTQDSRPEMFAHRVAPIQINYLGFPGTMGTKHLDYFIGDRVTVTDSNLPHLSENVIFLPNSFQPNPSQRPIGSRDSTRESHGLPESVFVFCCFNNVWKITPKVFKVWVRILRETEGSVLWLQNAGRTALENLSREFISAGINASRIIFASRLTSFSEHISRYRLADVFLDTFPYGAHTTASDALWAGLPVITQSGESFASRVASSLLHSVGLPELITETPQEYESLAVELAKNPERIAALKARLAENRAICPLFNTPLFAQHIESAYQAAYDRYHMGLPPDHIYVSP